MKRFLNWLDRLFGCPHSHTTFPFTPKPGRSPYVVCLDCGAEFSYDWASMKIVPRDLL